MKSNKPDVAEYFVLEGDISANENVVIVSSDSTVILIPMKKLRKEQKI